MDSLWVIPCRFDPARPVIYECVQAIQDHHDNPKILIVDSNSPDKSYLSWCVDRGCSIGPTNNELFGFGAHAWAQRHYPDCSFFYMIFDSLIVQSCCDEFRDRPVTVMRHWHSSQHDWGWTNSGEHLSIWGRQQLERMGIPWTDDYFGVFGPMMFIDRPSVEKLDAVGYYFAQTTTAQLQCAMERVSGIVLDAVLDCDIPSISLQGVHGSHESQYNEAFVAKRNLARQ